MWVDGVIVATHNIASATIWNSTQNYMVGASYNGFSSVYFLQPNCYMDELRVTVDTCLATTNYTPQTAAFPDS